MVILRWFGQRLAMGPKERSESRIPPSTLVSEKGPMVVPLIVKKSGEGSQGREEIKLVLERLFEEVM